MGRTAPLLWKVLFIAGFVAFVLLVWLAMILGILFQIGPFAGFTINLNPEIGARVLRYSVYFLAFIALTSFLVAIVDRYFLKNIPENFAAIIQSGDGLKKITVARQVWVMPRYESIAFVDLRPRDSMLTHEALTHDKLSVTLHVTLTWQPYVEDLEMVIKTNIQQETMLRSLVQRQLTLDISSRSLEEVQNHLRQIAFHVIRYVGYPEPPLDGARKYGIYLQEVLITKLDLPQEIVELNKARKLTELRKKYGPTQPGMSAG